MAGGKRRGGEGVPSNIFAVEWLLLSPSGLYKTAFAFFIHTETYCPEREGGRGGTQCVWAVAGFSTLNSPLSHEPCLQCILRIQRFLKNQSKIFACCNMLSGKKIRFVVALMIRNDDERWGGNFFFSLVCAADRLYLFCFVLFCFGGFFFLLTRIIS